MPMPNIDWKAIVRTVAPIAASAIGTPAMGAAVAMLSNAIFGEPSKSIEDVGAAIQSGALTGEQLVAIRQADNDFKLKMAQIGVDLQRLEAETEQAYLKDVQDARARQVATKDWMPQIILGVAFVVYAAQILLFYFGKMPSDEFTRALVVRAFGTIDGVLLTCVAYFVGSSRGSARHADTVRQMAEQQQSTAQQAAATAATAATAAAAATK